MILGFLGGVIPVHLTRAGIVEEDVLLHLGVFAGFADLDFRLSQFEFLEEFLFNLVQLFAEVVLAFFPLVVLCLELTVSSEAFDLH